MDGFHDTVCSAVKIITEKSEVKGSHINILSGFISPADIRNLKTIISEYGVDAVILPDYSDSLDNPCWQDYHLIPEGGTSVTDIKRMGSACGSVEMGHIMNKGSLKGRINKNIMTVTAGEWLQKEQY